MLRSTRTCQTTCLDLPASSENLPEPLPGPPETSNSQYGRAPTRTISLASSELQSHLGLVLIHLQSLLAPVTLPKTMSFLFPQVHGAFVQWPGKCPLFDFGVSFSLIIFKSSKAGQARLL